MGKVSLVSLGCPKNLVDSSDLLEKLRREGFIYSPDPGETDIILVNTCGFIEDAKRESVEEILRLREYRKEGRKLLVFGCLAKRYREELMREIPEIDALWGVGEEDRIVDYCKSIGGNRLNKADEKGATQGLMPSSYAYLKIADGCNRRCTYCVIPTLRGPYRSTEPDQILKKAESFVASGARELVLVAQDIGSYGKEWQGYTLPLLLKDLASISGQFWVRLLYLYPEDITDQLLSVIKEEDKICRYLDIPLQHSEDRVLRTMGRGGSRAEITRLIKEVRAAIPDIVLRTTFLVGFPGETEEDIRGMKRFIEEMRFDRLGVFAYSREEGTPAARMRQQVPKKIRGLRRDEIMRVQAQISLEKNRELIGTCVTALIDEKAGDVAVSRISTQAPEIDGVTFIEAPQAGGMTSDSMIRSFREMSVGDFITIRIIDAYDYDLKGEVRP